MVKRHREEAKVFFKHQVLFQDYGELLKEAEAKKWKLQKTTEKKLKLAAEVKYLRRKYKSFLRNRRQETPCQPKKLPPKMSSPSLQFTLPENSLNRPLKMSSPSYRFVQPRNLTNSSDLPFRYANQRVKEAETPCTSALFDLNKVSVPNAEEVEGIQVEWEPLKVANDLNLSISNDVGNGRNHVDKRKISWQDRVALKGQRRLVRL